MTEALTLQAEIDKATRDMEKSCDDTLRKIRKLKHTMNALEQTLGQGNSSMAADSMKALSHATKSLNNLSDSLLVRSRKAWQVYGRLEAKCKASGLDLARVEDIRVLCKRVEGMAADLLCYSLGHMKPMADPAR